MRDPDAASPPLLSGLLPDQGMNVTQSANSPQLPSTLQPLTHGAG